MPSRESGIAIRELQSGSIIRIVDLRVFGSYFLSRTSVSISQCGLSTYLYLDLYVDPQVKIHVLSSVKY
jgi:hypothetical protein